MLTAVFTAAQPFQNLLLPQARRVTGTIVDREGNPIAGARIDHSGVLRREFLTDVTGKFQLDTRAPALVLRKAGFQSVFLRVEGQREQRIQLPKLTEVRSFPTCASKGAYVGIEGWNAMFQFLKIPEIRIGPQVRDIDYGARDYYVETKSGRKGVTHGSGPVWDFGIPLDQDVWQAVKYEEIAYQKGKLTVTDARVELSSGNRWRYLGTFGESAAYFDVDEATAGILDKFMDSACSKRD